jgi:hypothetical protein
MDTNMKTCKQCGNIKAVSEFRPYYGGRKGHYKTCKLCEKINSRFKYLDAKPEPSPAEVSELTKIETLYEVLRKRGLRPPAQREPKLGMLDDLDAMIAQQRELLDAAPPVNTPEELHTWLTRDISHLEDWELEDAFDDLEDKYAPVVSTDPLTFRPTRSDEHRDTLEQIRERFGIK